jgi:hypothetical protein
MNKYKEQLCEKHNQHFSKSLKRCPICLGEDLVVDSELMVKAYEEGGEKKLKIVAENTIKKHGKNFINYFISHANAIMDPNINTS